VRGEPGDILIVKVRIVVANSSVSHNILNTQLGQLEGTGVSCVLLSAATIGDLLASKEVAVACAVRVEDCIGLLRATVERAHEKCEYPGMLYDRAGAAAVVAAAQQLHGNLE